MTNLYSSPLGEIFCNSNSEPGFSAGQFCKTYDYTTEGADLPDEFHASNIFKNAYCFLLIALLCLALTSNSQSYFHFLISFPEYFPQMKAWIFIGRKGGAGNG